MNLAYALKILPECLSNDIDKEDEITLEEIIKQAQTEIENFEQGKFFAMNEKDIKSVKVFLERLKV